MYSITINFPSKEAAIAYLQGDKTVKVTGGNVNQTVEATKEAEVVAPSIEADGAATVILNSTAKDAIKIIKENELPEGELRIAAGKETRTSVKKELDKEIEKRFNSQDVEVQQAPAQQQVQGSAALNAFNRDACISNVQQIIGNLKTLGMQDDQIGNEIFVASFQQAGLQPMRVTDLADSDLTRFFPAFKQVTDAKIAELQGAGQAAPQGGSFI